MQGHSQIATRRALAMMSGLRLWNSGLSPIVRTESSAVTV